MCVAHFLLLRYNSYAMHPENLVTWNPLPDHAVNWGAPTAWCDGKGPQGGAKASHFYHLRPGRPIPPLEERRPWLRKQTDCPQVARVGLGSRAQYPNGVGPAHSALTGRKTWGLMEVDGCFSSVIEWGGQSSCLEWQLAFCVPVYCSLSPAVIPIHLLKKTWGAAVASL